MLARPLRFLPAALVPVAAAWCLVPGASVPPPAVVALTVALVAGLAVFARRGLVVWSGPQGWLAALVAWAALDATLRPVSVSAAAALVATGGVALGLAVVARTPRVATWGRTAVAVAGIADAAWLIGERLLAAGRPAGPFGNPNLAATVALLALAMVPLVRAPMAVRAAALLVTAGGVVSSGSRAAIVGVVAVAFSWALSARGSGRVRAAAGGLLVVAVLGLAARLLADRDPLRYERVRIWGVAARVAQSEFPFGCGPGGYRDMAIARNFPRDGEFARFARIPELAESDFLQAAATLGAPGVVLLLGLVISTARLLRRGDPWGWGVLAAVLSTSAFNSQLMVPSVAWIVALAVGSVLPRPHGQREDASGVARTAIVTALAVAAGAVLAAPNWGAGLAPADRVERAATVLRERFGDDGALADAEAGAWSACLGRPQFDRGWRVLGGVRLARAKLRAEADLARGAAEAYAQARRANPNDAMAAFGEAQALRLLDDRPGAWRALNAAVALEPNFVSAWLEESLLYLEGGRLAPAREALRRAEAAVERARGVTFVSAYERTLAWADPGTVKRLRAAAGEEP